MKRIVFALFLASQLLVALPQAAYSAEANTAVVEVAVQRQRQCRLQVARINGQRVVVDRVTGQILRNRNGTLVRVNQLNRNRQAVVFLNNNRVSLSSLLVGRLLGGNIVVVNY